MSAILGIVRGHRGAVFVESGVGRGSTIRILFPALAEAQAVKNAAAVGHDAGAGTSALSGMVLVVDDEEIVRNVCKAMVQSFGMQVLTASDGREAVEVFRQNADGIGLVILDLTMPNMDGMTAFRELVRIRPGVKVILSSGYNEQDSIQRMSGTGLAGFIQKPYTMTGLREALEKAGKTGG
jgi:CheY-like chemotaxis protein